MTSVRSLIRIDADVRDRLDRLSPEIARCGTTADGSGEEIDARSTLLARVVWSRLIEPGDGVAGALIASLGAASALDLVVSNVNAQRVSALAAAGDPGAVLDVRELAAALARWRPRLDRSASLTDIDRALACGLRVVSPESDQWPQSLHDLGVHAPQLLWVRGTPAVLRLPSLAVVGARACTGYGANATAELVDAACASGATIVSGAAYGIDAVAHRAALAAGTPTVAVLAGGAERAYPAAHEPLLARIAEAGAVCSEMVPGAAPTRWRFLQRNRSIAALSGATLVTEAGVRSGSLNTAGHAAELGRDLGAVPGPVTSAASAGCHRLIREYGATLISNGEELREFIGAPSSADPLFSNAGDPRQPSAHRRVLDAFPLRGGKDAAALALAAGLAEAETRGVIAELELLGAVARVTSEPGGPPRWRLVRRT